MLMGFLTQQTSLGGTILYLRVWWGMLGPMGFMGLWWSNWLSNYQYGLIREIMMHKIMGWLTDLRNSWGWWGISPRWSNQWLDLREDFTPFFMEGTIQFYDPLGRSNTLMSETSQWCNVPSPSIYKMISKWYKMIQNVCVYIYTYYTYTLDTDGYRPYFLAVQLFNHYLGVAIIT